MKPFRTVELSVSDVEQAIRDLSLLVVSLDRIGSAYHDDPVQRVAAAGKYFEEIKAFKILAGIRGRLDEAYGNQRPKDDVTRLEESAENLPYWKPPRNL